MFKTDHSALCDGPEQFLTHWTLLKIGPNSTLANLTNFDAQKLKIIKTRMAKFVYFVVCYRLCV